MRRVFSLEHGGNAAVTRFANFGIELDASEDDEVCILANNFPVAKGTVVVSGNRIAVEVKELLPRSPDGR